jgi:hypothetical protein
MSMKSSLQMRLALLQQTLQPASRFQMQATKHRVLVIRDALAADIHVCEALLLKIEHLLGEETVPKANPCTLTTVAVAMGTERLLETAIQRKASSRIAAFSGYARASLKGPSADVCESRG